VNLQRSFAKNLRFFDALRSCGVELRRRKLAAEWSKLPGTDFPAIGRAAFSSQCTLRQRLVRKIGLPIRTQC
jgi:hypothetical protein